MATASKTTWSSLKVGLLAMIAMVILAALVFLLTGSNPLFSDDVDLYTYFADSAAVPKGAQVRLNGILVGEVKDVMLSGERDPARAVRFSLKVRRNMLQSIPTDSLATLASENPLGSRYINIKQGRQTATVQVNGTLPSLANPGFEEFLASGSNLLASLQDIASRLGNIVTLVESGEGNIGKFLKDEALYNRLVGTVSEVQTITKALNSDRGTIGKLVYDPELYNQLRASLARVDGIVARLDAGEGTAGKFLRDPALYNESQATIASLRQAVDDVNAGKGTVGKLLKSDELNNQILTTLGRVDTTIDRLNSGQGTIGQLLVNQQLYDSLNGTTNELQGLLKDFRANPKKFLRIKLALF